LIRALRKAIEADPRTINAIAVEAGLSAAAVWRFVECETQFVARQRGGSGGKRWDCTSHDVQSEKAVEATRLEF